MTRTSAIRHWEMGNLVSGGSGPFGQLRVPKNMQANDQPPLTCCILQFAFEGRTQESLMNPPESRRQRAIFLAIVCLIVVPFVATKYLSPKASVISLCVWAALFGQVEGQPRVPGLFRASQPNPVRRTTSGDRQTPEARTGTSSNVSWGCSDACHGDVAFIRARVHGALIQTVLGARNRPSLSGKADQAPTRTGRSRQSVGGR